MKKSELKLYTPYYNQTGYLSIIYNVTGTKYHIINYNGSIYSLTKDNNNIDYQEASITIQEFFDNFPKDKLQFESKVIYKAILHNYLSNRYGEEDKRVLLLII